MKLFRYSGEKTTLANNQKHKFALQHTLSIFESDSAYTFIPKNACSTIRFSIAKANGCIEDFNDVDWIHPNNPTFSLTTESAFKAKYKFVILRCPFSRLFSCYMDKLVNMDIQAWGYRNARGRTFHPHDLTFEYFIKDLGVAPYWQYDIHWRPQIDFMVYNQYDDIFCFEDFQWVEKRLKEKIDLLIFDTRPFLNHQVSSIETDPSILMPYTMATIDLLVLKRAGRIPEASKMYTEELTEIVKNRFSADLNLYLENFSPSPLMQKLL